ncbi:hypothetical protein MSPP1_001062 [Malassezia sp. CBS 17886]|nr:hypothetical protein MSPP1_001062 [Malassezia sp. CBS 17886]
MSERHTLQHMHRALATHTPPFGEVRQVRLHSARAGIRATGPFSDGVLASCAAPSDARAWQATSPAVRTPRVQWTPAGSRKRSFCSRSSSLSQSSSPTPAGCPANKRARATPSAARQSACISAAPRELRSPAYVPQMPVPRRRLHVRRPELVAVPRSPSALSPLFQEMSLSRSRLHGRTSPRTPGGMWMAHSSGVDMPTYPCTPPAPPAIFLSPPAADVECALGKCQVPAVNAAQGPLAPVRREWQFAYAGTMLSRDQMAFDKLGWKLDLAFARLACQNMDENDALARYSHRSSSLAKATARHVVAVLTSAWIPRSTHEYTYSPPSFRLTSVAREMLEPSHAAGPHGAHAAWARRMSAVLGAEMCERVVSHMVQTLWYMVTTDGGRSFSRPRVVAHFCAHFLRFMAQWEAQEHTNVRLLPTQHLNVGAATHLPTSALIKRLFACVLEKRLSVPPAAPTHVAADMRHLQVPALPRAVRAQRLARDPVGAPAAPDAAVFVSLPVDVARLLGELFLVDTIVHEALLVQWLEHLFLQPRQCVDVHANELEAACALLLLAGSHAAQRQTAAAHARPSRMQDVLRRCTARLEDIVASPLVSVSTKDWLWDVLSHGRRAWM